MRDSELPSTHHFSILTGWAISKAHYAIMTTQGPPTDIAKRCYDCPKVGTWTHTCWHCPGNPPPIPTTADRLQARLGPRVGMHQQNPPHHDYNETVFAHMVATRTYLLTKRYDTPEEPLRHSRNGIPYTACPLNLFSGGRPWQKTHIRTCGCCWVPLI